MITEWTVCPETMDRWESQASPGKDRKFPLGKAVAESVPPVPPALTDLPDRVEPPDLRVSPVCPDQTEAKAHPAHLVPKELQVHPVLTEDRAPKDRPASPARQEKVCLDQKAHSDLPVIPANPEPLGPTAVTGSPDHLAAPAFQGRTGTMAPQGQKVHLGPPVTPATTLSIALAHHARSCLPSSLTDICVLILGQKLCSIISFLHFIALFQSPADMSCIEKIPENKISMYLMQCQCLNRSKGHIFRLKF